jgi:hypothetical protein
VRNPSWQTVLAWTVLTFADAAFRRLVYRLPWPTRLGGRGLPVFIALDALLRFTRHAWLMPRVKRQAETYERVRADLTQRLGREPTREELAEYWSITADG